MNYQKEFILFFTNAERHTVSAEARLLWLALLWANFRSGPKKECTADNELLMKRAALNQESFNRAKDELIEEGYVELREEYETSTTYRLIPQEIVFNEKDEVMEKASLR
ncbi:hypothetical protein LF817_13140 [Halobacillus sp. A1]|uniref:hypothetical protein n=1 Tax=Halobacillus sp. A1 TaxID=2880262 RepID=UPI0020A6A20A|nr:hypothetical protein [Halobacillus sp. A1]MCP3032286.1 hypothetical protein [Halobacillus sp. A1]